MSDYVNIRSPVIKLHVILKLGNKVYNQMSTETLTLNNHGHACEFWHDDASSLTTGCAFLIIHDQDSLNRDISLKSLNSLFKATIDIYFRFLGIAYIKMCHDHQLSAVLAPDPSYACIDCSGELIRAKSPSIQYDDREMICPLKMCKIVGNVVNLDIR